MSEQERAARYSDLFGDHGDHAPDCAYCPICATIAVVRKTRPELLDHLAAAARELVIAAGIVLDEVADVVGAVPPTKKAGEPEEPRVRRIEVV